MMQKTAGLTTILISVLALTGCGASGLGAPTRNIKQVTDGVEAQSGSIYIRDILLVAQPDGSAALVGTIINEGSTLDVLAGITVEGIQMHLSSPEINLISNSPVIFSGESANATGVIPGLKAIAGTRVNVVVTFAHAAPVTLSAILRLKSDYLAGVGSATK